MVQPRTVSIEGSNMHRLAVGQLKGPIGCFTHEQLQSAQVLVEKELAKAESAGDETTVKRLEKDVKELKAELERRDLSAA